MRLVTICPTTGGLWMSRPTPKEGEAPEDFKPFLLWALTWDHQVVPYDPVEGVALVDHEIMSPFDDPMDMVDALDEAEDPFADLDE